MRDDQYRFLSLQPHLPARLNMEQAAWVLNCQPHDIPTLVSARLLKPLGNPPQNGVKFFCTAEVLELAKDKNWLTRVSNAVYQHWQRRNSGRKTRDAAGSLVEAGCPASTADVLSASARN
jgi:hypothetical protein